MNTGSIPCSSVKSVAKNLILQTKLFVLASTRAPMTRFLLAITILILACQFVFAQQTNPVDRKVANPMTDTPTVNPLHTDQPVPRRPAAQNGITATPTDDITVTSNKQSAAGPEDARIAHYEGNVDIRIGTYRLQADKVTVYEAENRV